MSVSILSVWYRAAPALFVVLWSTGFLGAKLGLPYAEPYTFLGIRMAIAAVLLLVFALLTRAPWPTSWAAAGHIAVAGLLIHGAYLGGVFSAIHAGLSAGVAALIVGIQPLLTAVAAGWLLHERLSARQWLGLVLGLVGVALVVSNKWYTGTITVIGLGFAVFALFGITFGTLYQKRYCAHMDLRSGGVIQYVATGMAMLGLAWVFESRVVIWSGELIFAMAWLVLVLSVGAVGLLYTLIRRGAAARVASLFYLVPPVTALFTYALFDEALSMLAILGMLIAMFGVALVNVPRRRK